MIKLLITTLLILNSVASYSYVISKTETGNDLKWDLAGNQLVIFSNPTPVGNKTIGITSSEVMSIFNDSISEWNSYTSFDLAPVYTSSLPALDNKFFFTSNSSYFGTGVLAVTEISYNVDTGSISNADIIINESAFNVINFTDDETQSSHLKAYLGDVLTHELGHFLGLSHSEVIGSSMVYSVFKNQHTVHSDDYSGAMDNYNKSLYAGEFTGRVIGGDGTAVFGAHVLMISALNGKVIQSNITLEDGTFHFKNVPSDDSYYFYVTPIKQTRSISDFYSTVVNSYCQNQESYKGSFYTKCGPRSKSRPQAFKVTGQETSVELGDITIRCDENLDTEYLSKKNETLDRGYEINSNLRDSSHVFVGMFSSSEVASGLSGAGDEYTLDLRSVDFNNLTPSSYKLKIDLASTGLGSSFDFQVKVKRVDEATFSTYVSSTDETGKTITDLMIDLNLSVANNNLFTIQVHPIALSTTQKYEIFSSTSNLTSAVSLYTINTQVGKYVGVDFVPLNMFVESAYDDNSLCAEGNINYLTQAYTPLSATGDSSQLKADDSLAAGISCGTIDLDDSSGPGTNGMSFIMGLFLMLTLCKLKRFTPMQSA